MHFRVWTDDQSLLGLNKMNFDVLDNAELTFLAIPLAGRYSSCWTYIVLKLFRPKRVMLGKSLGTDSLYKV